MRVTSLREQLVRAAVLTTLVVILLNAIALLTYEWVAYRKAWVANIQTTANYDMRDDNERRRAVDRFDC